MVCYQDIIEGELDKDALALVKDTHYRVILATLTTEQRGRTGNTVVDYNSCVTLNPSMLQLVFIIYRI